MPKPPRTPPRLMLPERTVRRFWPMLAMRLSTSALAPVPMLTPTITAAMPTIMPSMVRNERRMFRRNARNAILKTANIRSGELDGSLCGLELGQFFRGNETVLHRLVTTAQAVAHHDHPPAVAGDVQFMGHHHHRHPLVVQLLEDAHDLDARAGVEVSSRFVSQQQLG